MQQEQVEKREEKCSKPVKWMGTDAASAHAENASSSHTHTHNIITQAGQQHNIHNLDDNLGRPPGARICVAISGLPEF